MANPTLLNVAKSYRNNKTIAIAGDLIKRSGLLETAFFVKASNGLFDIDQYYADSLPSGSFRRINKGVSAENANAREVQFDLFPFTTYIPVDKAIAQKYKGGQAQFIIDKAPAFAEGMGQNLGAQLIYGTANDASGFKGLRQIAFENSKNIAVYSSGSGTTYTSILAVKWDLRKAHVLFNEEAFVKNQIFRLIAMNNGAEVVLYDGDGNAYPGYEYMAESYLGLKILGTKQVAALTGIMDSTNYKPTKAKIRELLRSIDAKADGTTFLYMNALARDLCGELMDSSMSLLDKEKMNIPLTCDSIDRIPVVVDDNFVQTEERAA